MKKLLAVLFATTMALTSCGMSTGASDLSAADFQSKFQEPGVVLLDVRTAGEYAAGHIDGAINIDVEGSSFAEEIQSLDSSKTYAIYCQSGRRSRAAIETMTNAGFANLFNLDTGITTWTDAGYPVVKNVS